MGEGTLLGVVSAIFYSLHLHFLRCRNPRCDDMGSKDAVHNEHDVECVYNLLDDGSLIVK